MSNDRTDILFPPGRLVAGSVKEPRTTDGDNRPLVVKTGANAGQPRVEYSFGVAIPKKGEPHWNQTPWGAQIWYAAAAAFPQGQHQLDTFSWKIVDGDSQKPNTKNKKPCDQEGYPGNWVVYFSSGLQPKTVNRDGSAPIDPATIERGYYVEVFGNVSGNGQIGNQAGIYINHQIVALNAYGDIIQSGPDAASVGFGAMAAPAGAMATPPAGMTQPPAQGQHTPPPPPPPQQQAAPAGHTPPPPPPPPQQQQVNPGAVQPDHSFVQNAAAPPPPPQQQAAPPERRFSYQGAAYTEAQLKGWGWTDAQINALTAA